MNSIFINIKRAFAGGFRVKAAFIVSALLALTGLAHASDGPGVVRVSLIEGTLSLKRAGTWANASLNTSLVPGDEVYVAGQGRAELELDAVDVLRLASGTDLKIESYEGREFQAQMISGTLSVTTRGKHFLDMEFDTPNMSVRPVHSGIIRIDVVKADATSAIVWKGRAEVFTPDGHTQVKSGHQIQVQGSTHPLFRIVEAPRRDDWDAWVNQREHRIEDARAYRYISPRIDGGDDLDAYGHWVYVPNYGRCWTPSVVVDDWTPYYFGRWVWTPYYGWTWVSYEPWGWAPYHYGRWFYTGGYGWVWWPGASPVWAPAYVSIFVNPGGWISWCPVSPWATYYGYSQYNYITYNTTYVNYVNNVTPLNMVPRHGSAVIVGRQRRGFVTVSANEFANGRVDRFGRRIRPSGTLHLIRGTAPVVPTARSLSALPGHGAAPHPRFGRVPVFTHRMPARIATPANLRTAQAALTRATVAHHIPLTPTAPLRTRVAGNSGALRSGLPPEHIAARGSGPAIAAAGRGIRSISTNPRARTNNGWTSFRSSSRTGESLAAAAAQARRQAGLGQAVRPRAHQRVSGGAIPAGVPGTNIRSNGVRSWTNAPSSSHANSGSSSWRHFSGAGRGERGGAAVYGAPATSSYSRHSSFSRARGLVNASGSEMENHPLSSASQAANSATAPWPRTTSGHNQPTAPVYQNHPVFENHPVTSGAQAHNGANESGPVYRRAPSGQQGGYNAPVYRAPGSTTGGQSAPSYHNYSRPSYSPPPAHSSTPSSSYTPAPSYHPSSSPPERSYSPPPSNSGGGQAPNGNWGHGRR